MEKNGPVLPSMSFFINHAILLNMKGHQKLSSIPLLLTDQLPIIDWSSKYGLCFQLSYGTNPIQMVSLYCQYDVNYLFH